MNQMMSWCPGPLPPCPPGNPWGGLEQCWNDVAALEELLTKIIKDMLAKDPNVFGTLGNIKGVTDGSVAPAGAVGELVAFSGSVAFPANNPVFVSLTNIGTLPAGDWNIWAWMGSTVAINGFTLDNVPTTDLSLDTDAQNALIPAGMGWMGTALEVSTGEDFNMPTMTSFYRGAGPVAIILRTILNTGSQAGEVVIGFLARRMR